MCVNNFTLGHYREIFKLALDLEYEIIMCNDYFTDNFKTNKILVNRVDVDVDCKKAKSIADIFNELRIKGTFFIRLHGKEYNPFDFENYLCLKHIRDSGHEIGLHSEIVDCSYIWNESAVQRLLTDVSVLDSMLNIKVNGIASHRGLTIYNNLDFWKHNKPQDYGLVYEAYENRLFNHSFYVSDALITSWKSYNNGDLQIGDNKCLCEHLKDNHNILYVLTHPMSYYERHIYESG